MSVTLEKWSPYILTALRVMTALLFIEHGLMKLVQFPAPQPGVPDPLPAILLIAAWIEVVGGGLLVVGLASRPVAFLCSGQMAVAHFMAHAPQSPWPAINQGDAAILFCFVFFYLFFAGPGALSLDAVLRQTRKAAAQ